MNSTPSLPRKSPCASCPFRVNVPSGIWGPEEYEKLPRYDGDMVGQSPKAFACHQFDGPSPAAVSLAVEVGAAVDDPGRASGPALVDDFARGKPGGGVPRS
ncbi:DUF6283 family protein [Frigoribacterium sp. UYMn621]|uniref:DUF6283 family protein n=1 Tax=Frigoribacterium sp. UYMn621 TaxID=3156343 RepID=UPI003397071A